MNPRIKKVPDEQGTRSGFAEQKTEKVPDGAATPIEDTKNDSVLLNHKKPWMASADSRCWDCDRFKNDTCNGLIDYNWKDCPKRNE